MNSTRSLVLLCGLFVAAGMVAMPPWRDLEVPPFGSAEHFGGYSPFYPPHEPWKLPWLVEHEFWNPQHEYRKNWLLLAVQEVVLGLLTLVTIFTRPGANQAAKQRDYSLTSGFLAIMAPALEAAPEARVWTTILLFGVYLAAIVFGTWTAASVGTAFVLRVLAGLVAGQVVVAYFVFALLPDASPASHRILLIVWLTATGIGAGAGLTWAKRRVLTQPYDGAGE